jgi:recombination protein RecR
LGYLPSVQKLIDEISKFPGIGPKSAQRIAYFILKSDENFVRELTESLLDVKRRVRFCKNCFDLAEDELCRICNDLRRQSSVLCVVEEPKDVIAIEKTNEFHGRYHVLGGVLSPLDAIGPEDLHFRELLVRIQNEGIDEVVVCTNPNLEGETTALYINKLLTPLGVKVSRLASGLPVGADLDYADEQTLSRAFSGRTLM